MEVFSRCIIFVDSTSSPSYWKKISLQSQKARLFVVKKAARNKAVLFMLLIKGEKSMCPSNFCLKNTNLIWNMTIIRQNK